MDFERIILTAISVLFVYFVWSLKKTLLSLENAIDDNTRLTRKTVNILIALITEHNKNHPDSTSLKNIINNIGGD